MSFNKNNDNSSGKLFNPVFLDVEQIVLHLIDGITLAPLKVSIVGDATQANVAFTFLCWNLDSFVYPLLTSDETIDWDGYKKERKGIIDRLDKAPDARAQAQIARELFELTVKVWNTQRLFKLKRQSYFGMRWKKTDVFEMKKLQAIDEEEGETD